MEIHGTDSKEEILMLVGITLIAFGFLFSSYGYLKAVVDQCQFENFCFSLVGGSVIGIGIRLLICL